MLHWHTWHIQSSGVLQVLKAQFPDCGTVRLRLVFYVTTQMEWSIPVVLCDKITSAKIILHSLIMFELTFQWAKEHTVDSYPTEIWRYNTHIRLCSLKKQSNTNCTDGHLVCRACAQSVLCGTVCFHTTGLFIVAPALCKNQPETRNLNLSLKYKHT